MIRFLKCISDETRYQMLKLLLEQRLCVCELTEILGKSQPCISQHLRRFKELELVVEERVEQWAYYQINHAVYQSYVKTLVNLQNECYAELGLADLEASLHKIKTVDLCKQKGK